MLLFALTDSGLSMRWASIVMVKGSSTFSGVPEAKPDNPIVGVPFLAGSETLTEISLFHTYYFDVSTCATGNSPSPVQGTIRKGDEEIENWPPRLGQVATRRWISTTEEG
jgi:hypothetical protein